MSIEVGISFFAFNEESGETCLGDPEQELNKKTTMETVKPVSLKFRIGMNCLPENNAEIL